MPALTLVGELQIGALCPIVLTTLGPVLAELQGKLAGCVALTAHLSATPPTVAANLQLCTQLLATLTLAVGLSPPSVDFQITAVAGLIAQIEVSLQALVALQALLGAKAFVFTYGGPTIGLGPAATSSFAAGFPDGSGPGTSCNALLIATADPVAWAAMSSFFGGAA